MIKLSFTAEGSPVRSGASLPDSQYTLHPVVNDEHGDVFLVCPLVENGPATTAFRVQSRHLQANSTFYDGMFNLPESRLNNTWKGLPVVEISETVVTMEAVLPVVCNLSKTVRNIADLDYDVALAVWEAGNKYEMFAVRTAAPACLR